MDEKEQQEILNRAQRRLKKSEPEEQAMLTEKQTLDILKVSHMTLKRYVSRGLIAKHKKGLSTLNWYLESDVESLKKQREEIH